MTAVNEFMHDAVANPGQTIVSPVHKLDGGRLMVRGGQNVLGTALVLAAIGLWIMPGSNFSTELSLIKLVVSVTSGLMGIGFLQQGKTPNTPEIEIDTVRREIRLVRREGKCVDCIQTCKFVDLKRAEVKGAHVVLWGQDNVMLAEVPLSDPRLRSSLMGSLADAGKL